MGLDQIIRGDQVRPTNSLNEFQKEEIEQSISDRYEKIVRLNPNRLAVKTRNITLSYLELNQIANRVARTILSLRGEGQEAVALLLDHDAPIIAAILGTLKAGKICVPLDPSFPRDRLGLHSRELPGTSRSD